MLTHRLGQLDEALAADAGPAAAPRPGWMAATPAGRCRPQRRYGQARAHRAERQRRNQQRRREDRQPADQVRISLGDAEAALGLDKLKVYRPLYHVPRVTDLDTPLLLAYDVFAQPNDNGLLQPRRERLAHLGVRGVTTLLADSSYAPGPQLALAEARGLTRYAPNVLAQPLLDAARQAVPGACDAYVLAVHDWSDLDFRSHATKHDRMVLGQAEELGYELHTCLLVSDAAGDPLAPVYQAVKSARGRTSRRRRRTAPWPEGRTNLDALASTIELGAPAALGPNRGP